MSPASASQHGWSAWPVRHGASVVRGGRRLRLGLAFSRRRVTRTIRGTARRRTENGDKFLYHSRSGHHDRPAAQFRDDPGESLEGKR
jgi:hypothetical protein